jgi:trimeric autotransporter adhesin
MSTKTTIKRIALVAAVAAAFGGLSTVAANATASTTIAVSGATGTGTATVTATATVGKYVSATITFTGDTNNATSVTSAGVGTINVPSIAAGTNNVATTGITSTGFTAFEADSTASVPGTSSHTLGSLDGTAVGALSISAYSATAGTQTISVASSTGTSTLTITWGAAPVTTAQYSSIVMVAGATVETHTLTASLVTLAGTNVANVNAASTAGSAAAEIGVVTNSSASNTITTDKITATISGPGTLAGGVTADTVPTLAVNASSGRSISVTETAGYAYFTVYADGTSGVGTITLTDATAGITLGSRTVTFTGSPAKATATQGLYVLKAGGTTPGTGAGAAQSATADAATSVATTSAVTATLVDANAVGVNGTVKIVSSNSAVISAVGCTQVTLSAGTYQCDVQGATGAISGQSATITFEAQDSTGAYTILAALLTFTIGGVVSTETLSTDASAYAALAPVKLTVTAKDSAGNAAYDQDATLVASLVSSTQLGGTLASPTKLVNGVGSVTGLYAPTVAGTVTVSGTDNLSVAGEAVTTSFASNGGSADAASAAATDAANEATDAADAATAAAQIAKIVKKLGA